MGPTFVDEPFRHHRCFNADPYWKREGYERRDAWQAATTGDTAILYRSSSVEQHPTCISHLLPIADKQIDADGALLQFETPIEITPKVSYQEIQRLVDQGAFSEKIRYCGQQGFNFTQISDFDLDKINELTSQVSTKKKSRRGSQRLLTASKKRRQKCCPAIPFQLLPNYISLYHGTDQVTLMRSHWTYPSTSYQ